MTAALDTFKMSCMNDSPPEYVVSHDTWLLPDSERKQILTLLIDNIILNYIDFFYNTPNSMDGRQDLVAVYGRELLSIGLFFLEYRDSIREGDDK